MPDPAAPDSPSVISNHRLAEPAEAYGWPPLETVHSSLIGVTLAVMGCAPRMIPVLLVVLALVTVVEVLRSGLQPRELINAVIAPLPMRAALVFLAFAVLSVLWASDKRFAMLTVGQMTTVVLATGTIATLLPQHIARLPAPRQNRFVRAVPMGAAAALVFLLVELATGNAISFAVVSRFPGLMGDNAKDFVREGDKLIGFVSFFLDRGVVAATLALPAALLGVTLWLKPSASRMALLAFAIVTVVVIALSASEAAKLALVCGGLAAWALVRWPVKSVSALKGIVAAGVLLALPLGHLPSSLGFETAAWLPYSARERAMIWDRTATAVRRAPVLGIGVQSTRNQEASETKFLEGVRGARRELGWHAHNMVLQTWLELGLIGALLLLGFAVSALSGIAGMAGRMRLTAGALFVVVVALGATGWGMWQPWLAGAIGMAVAALFVVSAGETVNSER